MLSIHTFMNDFFNKWKPRKKLGQPCVLISGLHRQRTPQDYRSEILLNDFLDLKTVQLQLVQGFGDIRLERRVVETVSTSI